MRFDVILIVAAVLCLLVGQSFGIWMSQDQQRFVFAPVHAHLNLAGWVTMALYGLAHRAFPVLGAAKLAPFQATLAIAGAIVMPYGIWIVLHGGGETVAIVGSLLVMAGTLLFAIMFVGKVAMAKAGASPAVAAA
ncbi:MAG TPA: hypothetical protein VG943_03610 [Caulobacterales bacterium]|nr:hypothetical protein [Caulobacterales bacterium]